MGLVLLSFLPKAPGKLKKKNYILLKFFKCIYFISVFNTNAIYFENRVRKKKPGWGDIYLFLLRSTILVGSRLLGGGRLLGSGRLLCGMLLGGRLLRGMLLGDRLLGYLFDSLLSSLSDGLLGSLCNSLLILTDTDTFIATLA